MKHLKKFKDLNESIFGDIARLNPDRKENDNKAKELIDEIMSDFNENDKDLRKVSIVDDGGSKVSFSSIEIGKSYRLSYVFGKFHTIHRNLKTGNKKDWDRRVTITNVPFFVTLKKNELEKAFNTGRVRTSQTRVEDVTQVPNYERNPRIPGKQHLFNPKVDKYRISYDIPAKLFKYFMDEYNKQYPDLKTSKYKSSDSIKDIKLGITPKDNKEGRIEKYDNFYKNLKDKWSKKIDSYLKKYDINLKSESEWEPYGFNLQITEDTIRLQFRVENEDTNIKDRLNKMVDNEDFGSYKKEHIRVEPGYKNQYQSVAVMMDTDPS